MLKTINKTHWLRVTKKNPCPICGKPGWCLISADGKKAICPRIESAIPAGNAGWLHNLSGEIPAITLPIQPERHSLKAPIETLNLAYTRLLSELTLSNTHRDSLLKRGLLQAQISVFNYKSMPESDRDRVIQRLLNQNIPLNGVPGFWVDSFGKWHLSGPHGIAIPIRDIKQRIAGLQIRCDETSSGKYKWLSSADRPNGCSSGIAVHVAKPDPYIQDETWLTEGPLKADIACLKLKRIVLAIPGVACWPKAVPILWQLKTKRVVVALDMDKETNHAVDIYRTQLINRLLTIGFVVYEANWDRNFKGIDDILVTGEVNG